MTGRTGLGRGLPRWVEVPLAAAGLLATAPLLGLAALSIAVSSPGPILFRQSRVGRGGEPFTLLKLRTMRATGRRGGRAGPPVTASGDPRVTPVGRWLRRSKVDELPELWNVVRGELALVGPRPEVPALVDLDDPAWRRVLAARPGLTDPVTLRLRDEEALLAGVDGDRQAFYRQSLQPWKLRGYADYLARRTPASDVAVLFRTLAAILRPPPPPSLAELGQTTDEG